MLGLQVGWKEEILMKDKFPCVICSSFYVPKFLMDLETLFEFAFRKFNLTTCVCEFNENLKCILFLILMEVDGGGFSSQWP